MSIDRSELKRILPPALYDKVMGEADGRVAPVGEPKRSKYGNKRTPALNQVWDSAKEARYATTLDLGQKGGVVKWWAFKPRFLLEGAVYVADFIVLWSDDRGLQVIDVKSDQKQPGQLGTRTKEYQHKRRSMLQRHGITITEV